ncbi:hypothetical protein AVEN_23389-1 [Araneus ventricosus]|uniref:Uncharacterized protein n=1 Tax=Araneus ventricosus TaxID=182803 RepID=A0A4Y2U854_ARAVE|nr:hypothetical protein AVEN_23389-1 [Araneus ventricosus]
MSSLEYKRCITKGLLTKSKPQPKRKGRPKSSGDEQTFCAKKRRKGNLSVSNDVRLENRGCHWPTFVSNRGRCLEEGDILPKSWQPEQATQGRMTTVEKLKWNKVVPYVIDEKGYINLCRGSCYCENVSQNDDVIGVSQGTSEIIIVSGRSQSTTALIFLDRVSLSCEIRVRDK